MKKISQKFAEYIGVKKIVKIRKSQIFGRFSSFCPTCSNIISGWFQSVGMKLHVFVHMVWVNHEKKFHKTPLNISA